MIVNWERLYRILWTLLVIGAVCVAGASWRG